MGTAVYVYPCDYGMGGLPMGYHNFQANQLGVVVCTLCGKTPK